MASGYATPIRLILDDDEKTAIRLNATRIGMSVERKVGGSPVPFSGGKRFGLDLNMSNSTIVIDGVFVDDTVDRADTAASGAVFDIDFGKSNAGSPGIVRFEEASIDMMVGTGIFNRATSYVLRDKSGTVVVKFSMNSFTGAGEGGGTAYGSSNNAYVQVGASSSTEWAIRCRGHGGSDATTAEVAQAIQHLMSNQSIGGVALTTKFTTTIADSNNTDIVTVANKRVVFTAAGDNKGLYTENGIQVDGVGNDVGEGGTVSVTSFGANASSGYRKSAGDKVQDLYGILHNTIRGGSAKLGATMSTGIGATTMIRLAGAALTEEQTVATATQEWKRSGDYPIGLQIPYNSMIQAPDGQLYTARNFFVPTGRRMKGEKGSEANSLSADVEFSTEDNYTGIQGTIKNMEIGYDAGEAVYRFSMTFLPIDAIF
mgnify:CR=1 FL=1|tara:strand:+ start:2246 stop:3529 length:1284 start_codon:yes stop_codon:yes gene_type:complete